MAVFVHVPKTAGSSIRQMLKKTSVQVIGHREVVGLQDIPNDQFVFAFVRNPWDRFVSTFYYLETNKIEDNCLDYAKYIHGMDFKQFVLSGDRTFLQQRHFRPQVEYLNPIQRVNFVGRYENLDSDWKKVCEIIGVEYRMLGRTNKSQHADYRQYYDQQMIDVVGEMYREDIRTFGYSFTKIE